MTLRLLVLGETGQVARALRALALAEGWLVSMAGRARLDLASADVAPLLERERPALVINAAAYTAVDRAESDEAAAFALNADLPRRAAAACAAHGAPLVHVSTDYVFDGSKNEPYVETDPLAPLGVYGRSKAAGEAAVQAADGRAAVVRTAWVYSPEGANFARTMLRLATDREEVDVVADQHGCPTTADDVACACLRLGRRLCAGEAEARGVFHAAGQGDASWAGFAEAIFAASSARGGASARVRPITTADYPTPAARPANSRLDCGKLERVAGWRPGPWREGLAQVMDRLVGPPAERIRRAAPAPRACAPP